MKTIKRLLSLLPLMLLWLMLSAFFWSWIFTFLTDTAPENKVTLFTNTWGCEDVQLAARLEQDKPDRLRMVRVHPFSYAMLDGDQLMNADLFVVKASEVNEYLTWFAPAPAELLDADRATWDVDGVPYGLLIYDAATDTGAASAYLTYTMPETENESCYLFFGAHSLHLPVNEKALDSAAIDVAGALLLLP